MTSATLNYFPIGQTQTESSPPSPYKPQIRRRYDTEFSKASFEKYRNSRFPAWVDSFLSQVNPLLELPINWNSYRSQKINFDLISVALDLLVRVMKDSTPSPVVVPTSDGGVQLEWHMRDIDLEIEINSSNFKVFFEDLRNQEEWECVVSIQDLSLIQRQINKLSSRS